LSSGCAALCSAAPLVAKEVVAKFGPAPTFSGSEIGSFAETAYGAGLGVAGAVVNGGVVYLGYALSKGAANSDYAYVNWLYSQGATPEEAGAVRDLLNVYSSFSPVPDDLLAQSYVVDSLADVSSVATDDAIVGAVEEIASDVALLLLL